MVSSDNRQVTARAQEDGQETPDGEADGSWVRALSGRGLGLAPASHPDTITRCTAILGARPVEWAVELGHRMSTRIIDEIPALGVGESAFEVLRPGPESAVLQSLLLIALNDPSLSGATPEALEGDRDFVRRGIPLDQVLRGIRLGHSLMAGGMLSAIAELISEPAATAEMKRTSELLFEFIDEFASMMTSEYLVERDRWVASAAAARGELVQTILDGTAVDLSAAAVTLAYQLERPHIALVLTHAGDIGPAITTLHNAAARILARLECSATLLIPQGAAKVWAWGTRRSFPADPPPLEELVGRAAITVGIGGPAAGLRRLPAGPRRSRARRSAGRQRRARRQWANPPLPRRRTRRPARRRHDHGPGLRHPRTRPPRAAIKSSGGTAPDPRRLPRHRTQPHPRRRAPAHRQEHRRLPGPQSRKPAPPRPARAHHRTAVRAPPSRVPARPAPRQRSRRVSLHGPCSCWQADS